jgi:hypothetical protein
VGAAEEASRKARMSSFITRPSRPLPRTFCRFTLCSLAIRRTAGVASTLSLAVEVTAADAASGSATGGGCGAGVGAACETDGVDAEATGAAAADEDPPTSISISGAPTLTS